MQTAALTALAVLALAPSAWCDVADSSPNGFTVKITMQIQAPPADVYRKIVNNIGDWWSPVHTFSHNPHNLSLDAKAQGCFCEKLANQGSVRHMEVLTAMPGERLVLSGAMGPLQPMALTATMTIQLAAAAGGTKLDLTYAAGGYVAGGLTNWAKILDSVMTDQMTRLKAFAETGSPEVKH